MLSLESSRVVLVKWLPVRSDIGGIFVLFKCSKKFYFITIIKIMHFVLIFTSVYALYYNVLICNICCFYMN